MVIGQSLRYSDSGRCVNYSHEEYQDRDVTIRGLPRGFRHEATFPKVPAIWLDQRLVDGWYGSAAGNRILLLLCGLRSVSNFVQLAQQLRWTALRPWRARFLRGIGQLIAVVAALKGLAINVGGRAKRSAGKNVYRQTRHSQRMFSSPPRPCDFQVERLLMKFDEIPDRDKFKVNVFLVDIEGVGAWVVKFRKSGVIINNRCEANIIRAYSCNLTRY